MIEDTRLRMFMAVAAEGSFTKAARKLGVSQPAVSQNMSELEKTVGAPLFVRARGEVRLTDAGKAFSEYAEKILYWYRAAENMFSSPSGVLQHPYVIRTDAMLASFVLPKAVGARMQADPSSRFVISTDASEDSADAVLACAPRTGGLDLSAGVLAGVLQAAYAVGKDCQVGDSDRLRIAVWRPYENMLTPDVRARVCLVSDSVEAVKATVAASSDIAGILPAVAVKGCAGFSILPEPLPALQMDVHFRASSPDSAVSLALMQYLEDFLSDF